MRKFLFLLLLINASTFAQHYSKLVVEVDNISHILTVNQELTYFNQSTQTLNSIVLNDWNNAYSVKDSPLGKRFSDEFIRTYLIAPEKDRGSTFDLKITDQNKNQIGFIRPQNYLDLVELQLDKPLLPNQKTTFILSYKLKIPNGRFTTYGFNLKDEMSLKNWFLTPARFENNAFLSYNNLNLDDAPNALFDLDLEIKSVQDFISKSKSNKAFGNKILY